ncbi:MAG: hypothetical protein WCC60_15100 [Ilumatobacteraceae bacterium]
MAEPVCAGEYTHRCDDIRMFADRIRAAMGYEFLRTAPPDGFPKFHDIATDRHTTRAFHDLEQQQSVAQHVGHRRPRERCPAPR